MDESIVLVNTKICEESKVIPNGFLKIEKMKIEEVGCIDRYRSGC